VSLTITIPLGKGPKTFTCKEKEKEWWEQSYLYECTKEKEPDTPKPEPPPTPPNRYREIFFCWAKADLNEGKCEPGPLDMGKESADNSAKAAAKNQQSFKELAADFRERYKVTQVTGYTSPEGPLGPLGKFEGNKVLADERAAKALELANERACFPRRSEICFAGGLEGVTRVNGGPISSKRAPEYPLLRKAEIRLAPPEETKEPEAATKSPVLNLPSDYLQCPQNVIDLAFPPQKEAKPDKQDVGPPCP
jgi:hypothetical protein